jgi:tetrathionate reductase subunit B
MREVRNEYRPASNADSLPAAAVAWKYVLAGTPEESPNYKMTDHWWGMLIDIPKCIGCGNCVRACQAENDVPDGTSAPGWSATTSRTGRWPTPGRSRPTPEVISPDGGKEGFPGCPMTRGSISSFPSCATTARIRPARRCARWARPSSAPDGVVLVDQKYCLGCAYCVQACPYGCRYIHPEKKVADKCTLCYHRITKGLTTACCEACPTGARQLADLKNPKDPIHEFLKTHSVQVLKPQMATGAKVFYNDLDGSVR